MLVTWLTSQLLILGALASVVQPANIAAILVTLVNTGASVAETADNSAQSMKALSKLDHTAVPHCSMAKTSRKSV